MRIPLIYAELVQVANSDVAVMHMSATTGVRQQSLLPKQTALTCSAS